MSESVRADRVQKVFEDANIKLASVATDVMGISNHAMLDQIVQGQADPAVPAELAKEHLRDKLDLLQEKRRSVGACRRMVDRFMLAST